MKKTLKLLVLAGALLSVGALAQATQNWNFSFPTYYYVYTNTTSIEFDFTASSASTSVVYNDNQATLGNLQTCIDNIVDGLNTSTTEPKAQTTQPTSWERFGSCEFGPTSVTTSGYTVNWNGEGNADGSLLVVTNAASYKVSVYADSVPTGVTYKLAAEFGDATTITFTTIPEGSGSATQIATDGDDYYTQYRNVYVIPLTFAADVEPNLDAIATTTTLVTYTASAP